MAAIKGKRQAFINEYMKDNNATQAAIRAGYSVNEKPPASRYYTYALLCPIKNEVFYIGKGKGKRVFCHVIENKSGTGCNKEKHQRITAILGRGMNVDHIILSEHTDENEAYKAEGIIVNAIGGDNLTNVALTGKVVKVRKRRFLPYIEDYASHSAWAVASLRLIEITEGDVSFLGKASASIERKVIEFLREVAHG